MGITQSKHELVKLTIKSMRTGMANDKLNIDFMNCLYNLPIAPQRIESKNISQYNILNGETLIPLIIMQDRLKNGMHNMNISFGPNEEGGKMPVLNLEDIINDIHEVYFATEEPDTERQLFNINEWYIIGKIKSGEYFTFYMNQLPLGNQSETVKNNRHYLTFYTDLKNVKQDYYYNSFKNKYACPFFSYINSL